MSNWDGFRNTLERVHTDFDFPEGLFENYDAGPYDPDTGQREEGEWVEIGTTSVELVPPSIDATVSVESGTDLGFDTSLRAPQSAIDGLDEELVPYGEDAEKPTRISVEGTTYELQGNAPEHGSGMVLLRVTEK